MKNFSINNESLELNAGKLYYVIDALYLDDVKKAILDDKILLFNIRKQVFPYTNTPFANYKVKNTIFNVNQIKKVDYDEVIEGDYTFFSTDTGLILLICEDIFVEFLNNYNYESLVDSDDELINYSYWESITSNFNINEIGLILANVNLENDFDGSGTYKIFSPS